MSEGFQHQLRTYRLWRTSAVLLVVGAVETGVLAYQRQSWLVGLVCLPLVALAMVAARRAARFRREFK
jgi:Flp pilus assembly protein TadB